MESNIKKAKYLLVLLLIVAMLGLAGGIALASDISSALYYGVILVSNNSTAASEVSTIMTLSTQELIDQGWIDSDCTYLAVRNSSGADVAFQPSANSTYPWCLWVPSIGNNTSLNYILYTGNASMSPSTCYFPDDEGMEVSDHSSLEISDNFSIELSGYIDTTAVGANITLKDGAFRTFISGSGNITSRIEEPVWTNPTGFNDPDTEWSDEGYAYDDNTANYAVEGAVPATSWSSFLELTISSTDLDSLQFYVDDLGVVTQIDCDAYYDSAWHDVYEGSFSDETWETKHLDGIHAVTAMRFRLYNGSGSPVALRLNEVDFGLRTTVTVSDVDSGEHTIITRADSDWANGEFIEILIDTDNLLQDSEFEMGYSPQMAWTSYQGTPTQESTIIKNGTYSAKFEATDTYGLLSQQIHEWESYIGETITIGVWAYEPSGSDVRWQFSDGVNYPAAAQTAGEEWEWLTVTATVDSGADRVQARCSVYGNGNIGYYDGAKMVVGSTCTPDTYPVVTMDLDGASVPDNSNNWTFCETDAMPYMEYCEVKVGGNQKGYWEWEYGETFTDQSGNNNTATPTFRTESSDEHVSATLVSFTPIDTAIAPAYTVAEAPDFISGNLTTSANATTGSISPVGPPGIELVEEAAEAGGTPNIWIWGILGMFIIAISGITLSWMEKSYGGGGGTLLMRIGVAAIIMGIFKAFGIFDWWMIVFYLFITVSIAIASRHVEWGGLSSQHNIIGFLAMSWVGLTAINRMVEGQFITSEETTFMNTLMFTQNFELFGIFNIPVMNFQFFTEGIPRLLRWDYSFFGGNAQIIQYLLYSITAVVSFIIFGLIIGLLYNYFNRLR